MCSSCIQEFISSTVQGVSESIGSRSIILIKAANIIIIILYHIVYIDQSIDNYLS